MAYRTTFEGVFVLDRPLAREHLAYLQRFCATPHLKRDGRLLESEPDPLRIAAGLPLGHEGAYFVGEAEAGSVIDPLAPPAGQPNRRCGWCPTDDGAGLQWCGDPAFADYVDWLEYLVGHFLAPWGYALSGEVRWQGEHEDDRGTLTARADRVSARDEGLFWNAPEDLEEAHSCGLRARCPTCWPSQP